MHRLQSPSGRRTVTLLLAVLAAVVSSTAGPAFSQEISVEDKAVASGFDGYLQGHFLRGRATVVADFDLDGLPDVYLGNPGDESFVAVSQMTGRRRSFRIRQILTRGALVWGGAAADYDNDGDYDLFLTGGGNEGMSFNYMFRNMMVEEGRLRFVDVTAAAGVAGAIPDGGTGPVPARYANAVWGDYDQDGDVDLYVSVHDTLRAGGPEGGETATGPQECGGPDLHGSAGVGGGLEGELMLDRNVLWRNEGDGTFTDVTVATGLDLTRWRSTRHSTFLDADNDGDLDIYENNYGSGNVLWRNLLAESGSAVFEDATLAYSAPGEDLQYPHLSFVSCAADFNQDGWEDIFAFQRASGETGPYADGHALFLNGGGTGFANAAEAAEINNPFQSGNGVMGSMVGDVNGDGLPDVYVGNGGPIAGQGNQLFLSDGQPGQAPHFVNRTDLIDFPAPERAGVVYPPYPYRTHGTALFDFDGDGILEIAVNNGGPAGSPDTVREPNRMFKMNLGFPAAWMTVRPVGDGSTVSLDAIGTRFALTVSRAGGAPWTVYRTLFAGSCFSAQNGFDVHFYAGEADTVHELRITWPDGSVETVGEGLALRGSYVVEKGAGGAAPKVRQVG